MNRSYLSNVTVTANADPNSLAALDHGGAEEHSPFNTGNSVNDGG